MEGAGRVLLSWWRRREEGIMLVQNKTLVNNRIIQHAQYLQHTDTYWPTLSTISSNNYHKLEDIKLDHFALIAQ